MHQLIMQGKILYWGTSEWSAQEIMEAHMVAQRFNLIGPVVEQPQYNMLVRDKVEVEYKQIYKTVGLGTTIWSPLASGLLTGKYLNNTASSTRLQRNELDWLAERLLTPENHAKVQKLHAFAQELGVSLPHLGPAKGDFGWWKVPAAEITGVRACQYDDEFVFNADGSYKMNFQGSAFVS